jgi:hypothetical protein
MLLPWAFPRFVDFVCPQELNPVLKPVLGKDKHDLIKLRPLNSSLLRSAPESLFQLLASCHVVIEVRPNH